MDKEHFFGIVENGQMLFTPIGKIAEKELSEIEKHFPYAEVPHYVVMPNHIHAIIIIDPVGTHTGASGFSQPSDAPVCVPTRRTALSVVVGCFKQAVTMYARRHNIDFGWQSRYHDHIVRNQEALNHISQYITDNPARWNIDCFNN